MSPSATKKKRVKKGIFGIAKSSILFRIGRGKHKLNDEDTDYNSSDDVDFLPEPDKKVHTRMLLTRLRVVRPFSDHDAHVNDLPNEILLKIFSLIVKANGSIKEIRVLSQTCKQWHSICSHYKTLWSNIDLSQMGDSLDMNKYLKYTISHDKYKYTHTLIFNNLKELKNDQLELILRNCSCSLSNLGIGNCPKLKTNALQSIANYCSNIKYLDISSLNGKIDNQNANCLFDKLKETLVHLNISNNSFVANALSNNLVKCEKLQYLNLSDLGSFTRINVDILPNSLKTFKFVNEFEDRCKTVEISKVLDPVKNFNQIEEFRFRTYEIALNSKSTFNFVVKKFCVDSLHLKIVELRGEQQALTSNILEFIRSNEIEQLIVSNFIISDKECDELSQIVCKCSKTLIRLDLSWSKIKEKCYFKLLNDLLNKDYPQLKYLNLSGTCVDMRMAKALMKNSKYLQELNLTSCRQVDRGFKRVIKLDELELSLLNSF